jgi:DDE family transposase
MIISNNITTYPFLTILINVGKRSFENMGRFIKKSGDTISRMLRPGGESLEASKKIAQQIFANKKTLIVTIDETTIKKIYSQMMEGTGWLFDTKIGRSINAYKLITASITDGKFTVPICAAFTFGREFYKNPSEAQEVTVRFFIKTASDLFPSVKIIASLDGAFATVSYLKWALENNIATEVRMHSNRVVEYKGKKKKLREIKEIRPKGRQMARTVSVVWQGLSLDVTAVRRIDKHGDETIVFQAATYKASPCQHAKNYRWRWGTEKMYRTTKQSMGLQECFSTKIGTQFNHICAVLLAYSIAQLEMKKNGLKNPEDAVRAFKKKNASSLKRQNNSLDEDIRAAYA